MKTRPLFGKVTIVGIGLLGGSLGLAIKKRRLAREVWGLARREQSRKKALKFKAVDQATLDLAAAVEGADLIVLATPVGGFTQILGALSLVAPRGCLVTDVGSVKGALVAQWEKASHPLAFVGSHPMAGSEKSGVEEARADLFQGTTCITTPTGRTSKDALKKVESLWRALGCRVIRLAPLGHDKKIGLLSHLPHAAAFSLMRAVGRGMSAGDWRLAGNGLRDTTRISGSDPAMWADIFLANRLEMKKDLEAFQNDLRVLLKCLSKNDRRGLLDFLGRSSRLRQALSRWGASKKRVGP
jgi:prephenate dehydrogenase